MIKDKYHNRKEQDRLEYLYDLSVVLPCRNERATVGLCVKQIRLMMRKYNLRGEVIVVDNASDDGSGLVASRHGAKVYRVSCPGYGYAIRTGLRKVQGRNIVICDCDMTYDIRDIVRVYKLLSTGKCDLVIGDRFAGGIETGAMPMIHKYGVKVLSLLGRWRFHTDVYDFHCGLRGITREAYKKLRFRTGGMEFATEMIAVSASNNLRICQLPVRLKRCRYPRHSKLRTIRDGMRHLVYILHPFRKSQAPHMSS